MDNDNYNGEYNDDDNDNTIFSFQRPIYKNSLIDGYYINSNIKNNNLFTMKSLVQILKKINYENRYNNDIYYHNQDLTFNIDDNTNRLPRTEWEKWSLLSSKTDPFTIKLLEENLNNVDWEILSGNPSAIRILEKNLDKVNSKTLSENPRAINILVNNPEFINFNHLLKNQNLDKIINLLKNTEFYNQIPEEIKLKICTKIRDNKKSTSYINNFYDKEYNEIIWSELNENDNLHNSERNMFKNENFSWLHLSEKMNSVEILRNRLPFYRDYFREKIIKNIEIDLLKYIVLSLDYDKMKENNKIFCRDLCKYIFNPIRIIRFSEKLNLSLDEYLELI